MGGGGESGFLVERCIGEVVGAGRSLSIGGAAAGHAHSAAASACTATMRHVTILSPRAFSSPLQENTRAGRDHRRYRPRQCKVASLVNISRRLRSHLPSPLVISIRYFQFYAGFVPRGISSILLLPCPLIIALYLVRRKEGTSFFLP